MSLFSRAQIAQCAIFGATVLALAGCKETEQQAAPAPPPPAVVVAQAKMQDLASASTYTGRIEAIDTVDLRARVSGYLEAFNFEEGKKVNKGDVLFEIERKPYEIVLAQAEANLASAKAALANAQVTYDRKKELAQKNIASQADLDNAEAALKQAEASIQARVADVENAKLNLSYTRILAPFSGIIGPKTYSPGAFLSAQSNPLATLVRQDPMYITFPVPQRVLLDVRKRGQNVDSVYVELILADGTSYDEKGKIQFADVQATASTDSVLIRASVPNPDGLLVDKQVVDVRVVANDPQEKLVIPQSALLLDQQGAYVLKVDQSKKVVLQRIKTGDEYGTSLVVTEGLKAGDEVIVSGQQKTRPGQEVAPNTMKDASSAANVNKQAQTKSE